MSHPNQRVEAKLRKLLALAQRGVGGEKQTAQRMLEKMLARHGLTLDDLTTERRVTRWFPAPNPYDRRLALQILAKVCDSSSVAIYKSAHKRRAVGVEVTPAEAIEFELHYDLLRKALAEHFDDAYSAFVQANMIFPKSGEVSSDISERDLRVMGMAEAVVPTAIHHRIEQGGADV